MKLSARFLARLASSNRQSKIKNRKSAFTLTELLVSMALIVFVMVILSEAFATGMDAFRRLKAVGDMEAAVRDAVTGLRKDLGSPHFDSDRTLSKLGLNPRINQNEISPPVGQGVQITPAQPYPPPGPPAALQPFLFDIDGDGEITFYDLNYRETNPATPYFNQFFAGLTHQLGPWRFPNQGIQGYPGYPGPNKIIDVNYNGIIDPGDLLSPRSSGGWADFNGFFAAPANGDTDFNGHINDILLGSSPNGWFCPELGFFTYGEGYWNRFASANQYEFTGGADAPYGPVLVEGVDGSGIPAFRDVNDFLHFTVRLSGNGPKDFFYGRVPPGSELDLAGLPQTRHDALAGTYASQWAEIIYFVLPDYEEVNPVTGIPLRDPATNDIRVRTTGNYNPNPTGTGGFYRIVRYNLYRRVLLLVPEAFTTPGQLAGVTRTIPVPGNGSPLLPGETAQQYWYRNYDVSATEVFPGNFQVNSPADVQIPQRRFRVFWNNPLYTPGLAGFHWDFFTGHALNSPQQRMSLQHQTQQASRRWGAELVLRDVLSFDVKVWDPSAAPVDPATGNLLLAPKGDFRDLGYYFWTPPGGPVSPICQPGNTSVLRPAILGQDIRVSNGNFNLGIPGSQFGGAGFNGFTQIQVNGNNTYPYIPRGFGNPIAPEKFIYDTWTARNAGPGTGANAEAQNLLNYADNSAHRYVPYPYPIRALQIKIRVWDQKTKQTRETTIVQNM